MGTETQGNNVQNQGNGNTQTPPEGGTQGAPQGGTQGAPQGGTEPKTFTQEEVNRIVQNRVAKYADYEDLKAKAAKLDEIEEANKSELQKATEKAASLQAELDGMKQAETIRAMRETVAKETGVPANLLTGGTEDECKAQAEAIKAYAKPGAYPNVKDGGEPQNNKGTATRDQFAAWLNNQG